MRLSKKASIVIITAAMLFSYSAPICQVSAEESERSVRVGIYYNEYGRDTRLFSAPNSSKTGFEIGYSTKDGFKKLFYIRNNEICLAPSVNMHIKNDDKLLHSGVGGDHTFGRHHIQLKTSYFDYKAAKSAAQNIKDAFIAYSNGRFYIRIGSFASEKEASAVIDSYPGSKAVSSSTGGITVCDVNENKMLFEYDNNEHRFALRAKDNGTVKLPTKSNNGLIYYSYKGYFEYSTDGKLLKLVNVIELEKYVKGVMPNEVGLNSSEEVARAFSVLIRTFACGGKHSGFRVCNSSCCQVYKGTFRQTELLNSIVDSTRGIVLSYDGNLARCFYNYSNGGTSCSSAAAWGSTPIPYLPSVALDENGKGVIWSKVFTEDELLSYLKSRPSYSSLKGGITDISIVETDPLGSDYVTAFSITDIHNNTVTVNNSASVKSSLGFDSSNFKVEYTFGKEIAYSNNSNNDFSTSIITADGVKKIDKINEPYKLLRAGGMTETIYADRVVFNGKGRGHGVGYSQVGAEELVANGYDYAYTLSFYFPGTVLAKASDILD